MLALRNPLRPILNPDDDDDYISSESLGPIIVGMLATGATAAIIRKTSSPEMSSRKALAYGMGIAFLPAWALTAWLSDKYR